MLRQELRVREIHIVLDNLFAHTNSVKTPQIRRWDDGAAVFPSTVPVFPFSAAYSDNVPSR